MKSTSHFAKSAQAYEQHRQYGFLVDYQCLSIGHEMDENNKKDRPVERTVMCKPIESKSVSYKLHDRKNIQLPMNII